jgi:hypothetical protein
MTRRAAALGAWVLAAVLAGAYLVVEPPSADLAAQLYRTELFEREGFAIWDNAWYAGHHLPGYSVLFPPLAALLGARLAGALAAVAAAVLFEKLVKDRFPGARAGAVWFAAATAVSLITGRLTFALGIAFALGALLADQRRHHWLAAILAVLTALASPVAGAFLAMAGVAWFIVGRRRPALLLTVGALVPVTLLTVAFPEGGTFPFVPSSFWPALATTLLVAAVLPREQKVLRMGAILYGLALIASFVIHTPMGGNTARLGALFSGPLVACALWGRKPVALALVAVPLLYWQWVAPVHDWVRASDDPSVHASYYEGVLGFLTTRDGEPFRVEVPFTANHWEGYLVARRVHMARGWERQLDVDRNELFYDGRPLTPARYRHWLDENAVRYVALPDVRLDHSAREESRLLRAGRSGLRPVWRDAHWRVWEVPGAATPARGATVTAWGTDSVTLDVPGRRPVLVRVRFTPYWALAEGRGCVERTPDGWTQLRMDEPGRARLVTRFAVGRVASRSARCDV